jgi:uncharacterized membrane protein HdeD (DUF308 family)
MQNPLEADVDTLARNWWAVVLRGVAAILFGLITFLAPAISLVALVLVFGIYALVDGVLSVVIAVRRRRETRRWWQLLLMGVVGIVAGVVTFLLPGITALALLFVIAAWALVAGAFELAAAIRLRKQIKGEWLLALAGLASIALGVLLVLFPGTGALAVVLWIGVYALITGALLIALGFRMRTHRTSGPDTAYTGIPTGPQQPIPH